MECDAGQLSAIPKTTILGVSRYKQSGRLALLKDKNDFTNNKAQHGQIHVSQLAGDRTVGCLHSLMEVLTSELQATNPVVHRFSCIHMWLEDILACTFHLIFI